mgnify:CR=1 FL=1
MTRIEKEYNRIAEYGCQIDELSLNSKFEEFFCVLGLKISRSFFLWVYMIKCGAEQQNIEICCSVLFILYLNLIFVHQSKRFTQNDLEYFFLIYNNWRG